MHAQLGPGALHVGTFQAVTLMHVAREGVCVSASLIKRLPCPKLFRQIWL